MKPVISQATIIASLIPGVGFEFQVTWTQTPDLTAFLKDSVFEVEQAQPLSKTSIGTPGTKRDVSFTPTGKKINLEDGQTYAALIGMIEDEHVPFVVCVADYGAWKQHQKDAETAHNQAILDKERSRHLKINFPNSTPGAAIKKVKGTNLNYRPTNTPLDVNIYAVELGGMTYKGNLTTIMAQVCRVWGEDPSESLEQIGVWRKRTPSKGGAYSYTSCKCPALPPANQMAITAGLAHQNANRQMMATV